MEGIADGIATNTPDKLARVDEAATPQQVRLELPDDHDASDRVCMKNVVAQVAVYESSLPRGMPGRWDRVYSRYLELAPSGELARNALACRLKRVTAKTVDLALR